MRVFSGCGLLSVATSIIAGAAIAAAASPDEHVLSLIPNSTQIVAGIDAPPSNGQTRNFLIFTRGNSVDVRDFKALIGVDDRSFIRQIFLVAGQRDRHAPIDHSLLAVGRFNRDRIYKAAIQNGALTRQYRHEQILELLPFARDRNMLKEIRWMAIIHDGLALFGTTDDVRDELDRHEDGACASASLVARLARLRSDDTAWYLMPALLPNDPARQSLGALSPDFRDAALDGFPFQFGFRFGRRVRIDYDFDTIEPQPPTPALPVQSTSNSNRRYGAQSFFDVPEGNRASVPLRRVNTISRQQYDKWVDQISTPGFGHS